MIPLFSVHLSHMQFVPLTFGHLAMTDTPIIPTAAKSKAKIIYRRLTEINSRYYGLSLMRTLTRGPNSVRYKGSWLYLEWNHSLIELCPNKQTKAFTVNSRLADISLLPTPCQYRQLLNAGRKFQTFDWNKLPLSQALAITDLRTPLSVPTAQFYCSYSRYNGHHSTSCGNIW